MPLWSMVCDILERPTIWGVLSELSLLMAPLWVAVIVGVVVGWVWKPNWANFGTDFLQSPGPKTASSSGASMGLPFSVPSLSTLKLQMLSYVSWLTDDGASRESSSSASPELKPDCRSFEAGKGSPSLVSNSDLEELYKLVEEKDEGPVWIKMMDRSTTTMGYQAWRRDLESGPPQYRSRTVFEDVTPEMARDFFWDDEFRMKWDDMLVSAETLEECPTTGTLMVKWVRKFPFFCSDREYIIGRRIWESGRLYYCITKGVPNNLARRNKPRRVDLYYSSWCIRAVESKRGDGQLTASEVLLFHYEDMGIPWEIAKLGVRQGMWGAVKKIEPGLRRYQKERSSGAPLSLCGFMAQINTKVSTDYLKSLESSSNNSSSEIDTPDSPEKPGKNSIPRLLVVGGAIALACTLDRGLLTKAVIFGVARKFARGGRRL